MDPSALQPITLPVMNSLVSTNKVVVDASIDAEMVTEFPSDAQNPLDYIHKAGNETSGPVKQIQVTAQPAVLPKIVRCVCIIYTSALCLLFSVKSLIKFYILFVYFSVVLLIPNLWSAFRIRKYQILLWKALPIHPLQ